MQTCFPILSSFFDVVSIAMSYNGLHGRVHMKKLFLLSVLACIVFSLCCCTEKEIDDDGTISFNGKKYICTFSDEFESEKLDTKNWAYCPQQQRQDAGGWWSNKCSTFENGNYVITCKLKNETPVSGGIRSRGRFE
jgi:hypothetical protein